MLLNMQQYYIFNTNTWKSLGFFKLIDSVPNYFGFEFLDCELIQVHFGRDMSGIFLFSTPSRLWLLPEEVWWKSLTKNDHTATARAGSRIKKHAWKCRLAVWSRPCWEDFLALVNHGFQGKKWLDGFKFHKFGSTRPIKEFSRYWYSSFPSQHKNHNNRIRNKQRSKGVL